MRLIQSGRRFEASLLVGLALAFGLAVPASAGAQTPTLSGEAFIEHASGPLRYSGTCNPTGDSTFTYTTSGVASGPYPGTYTEHGTVTIGPQNGPSRGFEPNPVEPGFLPGSREFGTGSVLSVQAEFSIDSPAGQVTGTKTTSVLTSAGRGACRDLVDELFPEPGQVGTGWIRDASTYVNYSATIKTSTGAFQDQGSAFLFAQDYGAVFTSGASIVGLHFVEAFTSDLSEATPLGPQKKEDCMKNAWRNYPGFKNQGDCVAFIATGGKNEPGQNVP